jgi:hypothetical protein
MRLRDGVYYETEGGGYLKGVVAVIDISLLGTFAGKPL